MTFRIAEQAHLVNIVAPVDLDTAAVTSDAWSMENYNHVDVIIQLGVTGATCDITVEECTAADGTGATAIGFSYYAETDAAGDVLGARTTATAAGFTTSANDGILYCISIDSSELSSGSKWLRVQFSDPGAATYGSAVAVLSGARYASEQSPTAIS